jgi:linoleate 10R-lipoxygenase
MIQTITQVFCLIFQLKNLRRGPGESGHLNRFVEDVYGSKQYVYVDFNGDITSYPTSLIVQYDL